MSSILRGSFNLYFIINSFRKSCSQQLPSCQEKLDEASPEHNFELMMVASSSLVACG
jgi:hypothetical protein